MKIYVASSWRNNFQPDVVAKLRQAGHTVYDFKGPGDGWGMEGGGPGGFSWSEVDTDWQNWPSDIPRYLRGLNHPRAIEGFNRDMDALKQSDACVMVMPCGPSASMEMGWACGAGRKVVVYIPGMREPDLMVKMADLVTDDMVSVLQYLSVPVARGCRPNDQRWSLLEQWWNENPEMRYSEVMCGENLRVRVRLYELQSGRAYRSVMVGQAEAGTQDEAVRLALEKPLC